MIESLSELGLKKSLIYKIQQPINLLRDKGGGVEGGQKHRTTDGQTSGIHRPRGLLSEKTNKSTKCRDIIGTDRDRQGQTLDRDRHEQTGTNRDRQGETGTGRGIKGQAGTYREIQR